MSFELRTLIAQTFLAEAGLYKGKLDGEWGPLSKAAAEAWDDKEILIAIPKGTTPYDLAKTHLGTKEIPGSKHNLKIVTWLKRLEAWINDDETAWCSAFVDAMAAEAGYERTGKLNARSWLQVGEAVALNKARPGDIAIFWRISEHGWQGHVAFFVSRHPEQIRVLGGNQGNSVSYASYPESRLLAIRRLRSLDQLQGPSRNV